MEPAKHFFFVSCVAIQKANAGGPPPNIQRCLAWGVTSIKKHDEELDGKGADRISLPQMAVLATSEAEAFKLGDEYIKKTCPESEGWIHHRTAVFKLSKDELTNVLTRIA